MAEDSESKLPASDPKKKPFEPEVLDRTVIAIPLLRDLQGDREEGRLTQSYDVIIDLNLDFVGGREAAGKRVAKLIPEATKKAECDPSKSQVDRKKSKFTDQYLFATLEGRVIEKLVEIDGKSDWKDRAIYRIWPDFEIQALITRSVCTVKADAARNAFAALGRDIVWAVMDSGIQGDHCHFELYDNLTLPKQLKHQDFTKPDGTPESALVDEFGHGTHVAGILAGQYGPKLRNGKDVPPVFAASRLRDERGNVTVDSVEIKQISGMAPQCKLLSLKVLDAKGKSGTGEGKASSLIAALAYVHQINDYGRMLRVHGVNMSVGYDFKPEWFACGQSPLCVEVDRLVNSGVVVVVAAGNTGYGYVASKFKGNVAAGMDLTINDPGNAEQAITVGSTHREMPHRYGVSYFSSKGPTGDGRRKPDLVAPGEKILSCATGKPLEKFDGPLEAGKEYRYVEDSGTSMAAPHVSGVIAAFLSIRREFIGQPLRVKEIFMSTATDLHREPYFQGRGLIDLMRAIQSI